jgi:ComEC/Rec2-related protein
VSAAALIGVLLAIVMPLPWWWFAVMAVGTGVLVLAMDRPGAIGLLIVCCLCAAAWGQWRNARHSIRAPMLSAVAGQLVRVRIRVEQWPDARVMHIAGVGPCADHVRLRGAPRYQGTQFDMVARVGTDRLGRTVLYPGTMQRVTRGPPPGPVAVLRSLAAGRLRASPAPRGRAQSLVQASVLGRRDGPFNSLFKPFRDTGTAHLLAVSGLHLALVAGLVLVLRRFLSAPAQLDAWLVAAAACTMLLLVEVRPPLARAAAMGLTLALGPMLHRRLSGATALCVAGLVALLIEPAVVRQPGPQLSFTVVAALVWLLPVVEARARRELRRTSMVHRAWRTGLIAWLASTPIVLHHFGRAGPLAVPAGIAMVPMLTVLLGAGWCRVLLPPGVADIPTGWLMDWSSAALLWAVDLLVLIPGSTWATVRPPGWWAFLAEAVVLAGCLRPGRWCWAAVAGLWLLM